MKQPTIIFFLFIFLNTFAQDVSNRKDEKGLKQGYWVYLGKDRPETGIPPDGKVEEGNYIDDKKEGVWTKYHDNGITPKLKGEYENNRPYGHFTKYHPNGKLKERGYYIRNHYADTLERFFENGNLEFFGTYDSIGKEHGTIRKYNTDGSINCEYEAVHGTIPNRPDCLPPLVNCGYTTKTPLSPEVGPVYIEKIPPLDPYTNEPTYPNRTGTMPNTKSVKWQPNGYNKVYNSANDIWQDGIFKNGKLWDGKVYLYSLEGILMKVKVYKNGVYHSDGQL